MIDLHPSLTRPVMAVIRERSHIQCAVIKQGIRALPQLTGISGDHPLQRVRKLVRNTPGSFVAESVEQLEDMAARHGAVDMPTAIYTPRKGWAYLTLNSTDTPAHRVY